jgi:hypothetical protein
MVGDEAPPWHAAVAHRPSPVLLRIGNTFFAQLTAHVGVTEPPESAVAAEPSGPFIVPGPVLPLPLEPLPPPELPLGADDPLPEDAGPDDDPEPDDEVGMPAGSGGVMRESPFGGP